MGDQSFYGTSKTVDTSKPFTVVTQFVTADGTDSGTLAQINRFYVQGGKTIPNSVGRYYRSLLLLRPFAAGYTTVHAGSIQLTHPPVSVQGIDPVNHISDNYCKQQKTVFKDNNYFSTVGGLAAMGKSLTKMVLVLSVWDDQYVLFALVLSICTEERPPPPPPKKGKKKKGFP